MSLGIKDRNRLFKIVNKWLTGTYNTHLKDFDNVKYGERNLMDVFDYDKLKDYTTWDSSKGSLNPTELLKAKEEYVRLMASGQ